MLLSSWLSLVHLAVELHLLRVRHSLQVDMAILLSEAAIHVPHCRTQGVNKSRALRSIVGAGFNVDRLSCHQVCCLDGPFRFNIVLVDTGASLRRRLGYFFVLGGL